MEFRRLSLLMLVFPIPFPGKPFVGNISAPPLFASELPSKDMAAPLGDAVQSSSSSVHVTAGMIRIRDMPVRVRGSQLQWVMRLDWYCQCGSFL
ncbi:NAC domain-containing protein 53 [Bienertia sinuspersici]